MRENRIRQITVEQVVNIPDSLVTNFSSMIYTVGRTRPFFINDKNVKMTISEIIETDKGFKIFITDKSTTQEWIVLNSKERVTVYNFID